MQQRRGTEAQWTSANPVLAAGEIGFEIDTNKFKVGDGINQWADLSYFLDQEALGGSFDDYIPLTEKGVAEGVATLDANGNVPVSQLGNIIDGAPEILNTLNELANAIGDDADFITTVNTELGILGSANTSNANAIETINTQLSVVEGNLLATSNNVTTLEGSLETAETNISNLQTSMQSAELAIDTVESDVSTLQTSVASQTTIIDEINSDVSALQTDVSSIQTDLGTVTSDLANLTSTVSTNYTTLETNLSNHDLDTTNVHGISDTAELETQTGAQAKADNAQLAAETTAAADATAKANAAQAAAETYADGILSTHSSDTTNVHGIADTSKIVMMDAVSTTLDGSLTVDGDLIINGTTTTVSAQDLVVSDPLIYIGEGNTANLVDLGLVSSFNDGTYQHAGIVRDASAGKWKVFKGVTDEPTTTINFAQGSLDDLAVNNIEVSGVVFTDGTQTKQGVPSLTPINQKTASYTTVLTDRDSLIEISSASATTLTIPTDASVNYPVGTSFDVLQTGAGQVTIAGAGGVTVNATPGLKLRTQWSSATIFKRAANTWVVYGDLSA